MFRWSTVQVQAMIVNRELQRISKVPRVFGEETKLRELLFGRVHSGVKVVMAWASRGSQVRRRRSDRVRAMVQGLLRRRIPAPLLMEVQLPLRASKEEDCRFVICR